MFQATAHVEDDGSNNIRDVLSVRRAEAGGEHGGPGEAGDVEAVAVGGGAGGVVDER